MRRVWIVLALLMGSFAAAAQEPQPQPQPQEKPKEVIVISSPLNPQDAFNIPYSVGAVTGDELRGRNSRTTPEALKEMPGIGVQKTGIGQGSPFIRGFTGFRNVMLIDGIRLNNSLFREGPNQYWGTVDPYLIDRLEVIRGPSSVLYGSDSIGGTAYVFTRSPDLEEAPLHSRTLYRYASAENSHTARQEFGGTEGDFGWLLGGTYRNFDDLMGGRHTGLMKHSGYDEYDGDVKFVLRLNPTSKLVAAFQHTRQSDAPRWHSTLYSKSFHGTTVSGSTDTRDFDQGRNLAYLQYHLETPGGLIDAFKASLSIHRQTERERILATAVAPATAVKAFETTFEVDTPAVWIQAGKQTPLGYFTFGAEYYRDLVRSDGHYFQVDGTRIDFDRGIVAGDATYDQMGVYVQDEFSIGALDVAPGVRFSRSSVDAKDIQRFAGDPGVPFNDLDEDYQAVTGSLRLLYHVTEHWNAIAGWGMGFRAPGLTDSTSFTLALSGTVELPTADLDPEKFHTFDLGLRAKYPTWEFSAFGYYTVIDDMIIRVATALPPSPPPGATGAALKENNSQGYVYGGEVSALYRFTTEISFFGDWGYSRGYSEQYLNASTRDKEPLGKVPPQVFHFGARYEPEASSVWIEGLVTVADRQKHMGPGDNTDTQRIPPKHGTPGYTSYALRGGYRISKHLSATAAVENITNHDYRSHGSGVNEPGTNFILGLDAKF